MSKQICICVGIAVRKIYAVIRSVMHVTERKCIVRQPFRLGSSLKEVLVVAHVTSLPTPSAVCAIFGISLRKNERLHSIIVHGIWFLEIDKVEFVFYPRDQTKNAEEIPLGKGAVVDIWGNNQIIFCLSCLDSLVQIATLEA